MTKTFSFLSKDAHLRTASGGRFRRVLALSMAVAALSGGSAQATNYYWDDNGATTGSSATPNGTLGTSAFLNTSSTGGNGTFSTVPTSADTIFFSALSSTTDSTSAGMAYTVGVNGTQSVGGLVFYSAGALTLGDPTSTINVGAAGLTFDRYIDGSTGGTTTGAVTINSNLVLTADQTWAAANIPNPGFTINGTTTGTGNLTVNETINRAITLNGAINMTGSLSFKGGNSVAAVVNVIGAIGSNVTNLTVQMSTNNPIDSVTLSSTTGNAYSGTTAVNAGTLLLNSGSATSTVSLTGAGAVNVTGTTAELAGNNGVSTGLLTVTSNGVIAPGGKAGASYQSIGTLHLGTVGGVTLTQATMDFDLAATTATASDKIILGTGTTATGALTLGAIVFNFEGAASATATALQTGTPYTLITAATTTGFNTANITTNFLGGLSGQGYTATYTDDGSNFQVTFSAAAVPEPSTLVGGALLVGLLAWRERQRLGGLFA